MAYSISTHNGTSFSLGHNRRDEKVIEGQSHIDKNGYHKSWLDNSLPEIYEKIFGSSVKEYNDNQKRDERKIDNYYRKIVNDKKKNVAYEMIVAVGNRNERPDTETCRQILKKFIDGWSKRNPNLLLVGVYYHADEEGAPHIHIDYIPVAKNCKRGMKVQNSLTQALKQQGFVTQKGKGTAQIQWQKRENEALEEICIEYGLEIKHEQRGKSVKHLHTEVYKLEKGINEQKAEQKRLSEEVKATENTLNTTKNALRVQKKALSDYEMMLKSNSGINKKSKFGKKLVDINELEKFENLQKSSNDILDQAYSLIQNAENINLENKEKEKKLKAKEKELQMREEAFKDVEKYANEIISEAKEKAEKIVKTAQEERNNLTQSLVEQNNELYQIKNNLGEKILKKAKDLFERFKSDYTKFLEKALDDMGKLEKVQDKFEEALEQNINIDDEELDL